MILPRTSVTAACWDGLMKHVPRMKIPQKQIHTGKVALLSYILYTQDITHSNRYCGETGLFLLLVKSFPKLVFLPSFVKYTVISHFLLTQPLNQTLWCSAIFALRDY